MNIKDGKTCPKCGLFKPYTEYPKNKTSPTGYGYWCRECQRKQDYKRRNGHEMPDGYISQHKKADNNAEMIMKMWEERKTAKEISQITGISETSIRARIVKKYGTSRQVRPPKKPKKKIKPKKDEAELQRAKEKRKEQNLQKTLKWVENYPDYEYAGGYVNSDGRIDLRHKQCGEIVSFALVTLRQGYKCECPYCKNKKKEEKQKAIEEEQKKKEEERRIKREERREKEERKRRDVYCVECGTQFTTNNSRRKYCSEKCNKAYNNRERKRVRDERIAGKCVDNDITLERLFRRDHGRCWLCGGVCDTTDYRVVDGTTICGNNYPSIDHVVPLSKGGLHAWENIKLAHRGCNTKKGDKIIDYVEIRRGHRAHDVVNSARAM